MRKICIVFVGFIALIQLFSCDEPTLVGKDLIPDDDALALDSIQFNNLPINMYRDDSILNSSLTTMMLGKNIDPLIGSSVANIYGELYFAGGFKRLANGVFDSLVLHLSTNDFVGDTTVSQTIQVFALADSLRSESEGFYYLKDSIEVGNLLGEFTDILYSSDSTKINGILTSSHISTHLDPLFGGDIFQQLNDSLLTTNREFQTYFKGLGIKATNSATGAGWFQINTQAASPAITGLSLHYHNADDTINYRFPLSWLADYTSEGTFFPGSQNLNQINTLYSNNLISDFLNVPSPTGNETNYLGSGNGIYLEVDFSELVDQLNTNDVVNFAELTIKPTLENLADTIKLPDAFTIGNSFVRNNENEKTGPIFGVDGTNVTGTPTDDRIFDNTYFAYREKLSEGDYQYRFQLPGTIQSMHINILPTKLYILPTKRATTFDHIRFNSSDVKMKLIYTTK